MKYLDQTWADPAEDLACDEALLDACEEDPRESVLRVYQPGRPCVVVGFGNARATEVNLDACREDGVPVLRRASGGGTVVLGPGCLAYSVVLGMGTDPALGSVTGTNAWVMGRQRAILGRLLGQGVQIEGVTDLVWAGRKVSGNAQRRRSRAILFHGTLLLSMDLSWIERYLHMPSLRPAYRADRPHHAFVGNLGLEAGVVKAALREGWQADEGHGGVAGERIRALMEARYGQSSWHARR